MNKYLVIAVWGIYLHVLAENAYQAEQQARAWWTDHGHPCGINDIETVTEDN